MKINKFFPIIVFQLLSFVVQAQFNLKALDKLTDKTNNVLSNDLVGDGLSSINKKLADSRREFEEKTFNYAISLSDNAGLFENEERFSKNKNLFLGSLATYSNDVTPIDMASSRNNTGEMLYASNKYVMAEQAFNKAIEICETNGLTNQAIYALAISNKGLLLHTMGRYAQAEQFTQQGMELRKKMMGDQSAVFAASVNNLAVLNKDMGDYQEALELIDQSMAINTKALGKQSMAYAINLNNKAIMQQAIGHYDESVKLMSEALVIAEKELGEKSNNFLRMKTNLALIYKDMGKFTEAEQVLKECIRRKEKKLGSNHPDYAHMITNLAMLYQLMGKSNEVEDLLKKAQGIYKKKFGEEHPAYATASANLGNYYRNQKKTDLAMPLLKKALEVRKSTLGENHPEYVSSLEDMAIANWVLGNYPEASAHYALAIDKTLDFINTFFPSMSESEKNKLWSRFFPRINRYYSYAVHTNQTQEISRMFDLHISTKGILLSASSKVKEKILNSGNPELVKLYKQWVDQKEELVRLYAYSKTELQEQKINLDSLEKAANLSEKKLSQKSDLFTEGIKKNAYSWKDILAVLTDQEACVEVISFKKYDGVKIDSAQYVALVLAKGTGMPTLKRLKFGPQLDKRYYNYYVNCIKNQKEDKLSYVAFWKEIDSLVLQTQRVYVSLDGIFNQVNLNSLKNHDNGKYILESKQLVLLGNSREIPNYKKNAKKQTSKTMWMLANPFYGENNLVPSLPGTQKEADLIKQIMTPLGYKISSFNQKQADEKNLKTVSNPGILHIATHGFFLKDEADDGYDDGLSMGIEENKAKENPMLRSGLMLANCEGAMQGKDNKAVKSANNGILTAFEASNLNLDKTSLVVMSACETGLGDVKSGEGVYGLQRAFQVAGVDAIMMSLWKVNDDATQKLMGFFYKNLTAGMEKQRALQEAQKSLMKTLPHPYFWGAFVLLGV